MASLYGYIEYDHHAGFVHRLAHRIIKVGARTWNEEVLVQLSKDGIARITISDIHSNKTKILFVGDIKAILNETCSV